MAITAFLSRSPWLFKWGPSLTGTWSSFQHLLSNWSELQLQLLNRGPKGPLCWLLVLSIASYLQLTWTSCRRGYIIIWRPLFFLQASQFRTQFNPSTVKFISWYSSTGCTRYLHRCISYFDSLAGSEVNIQHYWVKSYLLLLEIDSSTGHSVNSMNLVGCVPSSGHTSSLKGPSTQALTLLGG